MKSYNDTKLLLGLLIIGIAGGFAGRALESANVAIPDTGNLNQAAAILATEQNIIGTTNPEIEPTISVGLGSVKDADISFSERRDCTDGLSIKTAQGRTIGFICIPDADSAIIVPEAASRVNAIVVSLGKTNEAAAKEALANGAVAVITHTNDEVFVWTKEKSLTGSTFRFDITGKNTSNLKVVKK